MTKEVTVVEAMTAGLCTALVLIALVAIVQAVRDGIKSLLNKEDK